MFRPQQLLLNVILTSLRAKMIVTLTLCKNGYLFTLENKVGSHYFLLKTQVVLATPNISDCSIVVPKQTHVVKLSCRISTR